MTDLGVLFMFEDSLVMSRVGRSSAAARWTWAGSVVLQMGLAAAVVLAPLLRPARMRFGVEAPRVVLPLVVPVKAPPVRMEARLTAANPMSATATVERMFAAPARIPVGISREDGPAPVLGMGAMAMGGAGVPGVGMGAIAIGGAGVPGVLSGVGSGVAVSAAPAAAEVRARGPVRVSSGVAAGMLLAPIRPVYPAIARAAHVEGTVVVAAVISKAGRVESLRVVSGPAMLASAAVEAISAARYTPYQLNGAPTEVETTITVNFRMGG